jgi:hypothetical protein
MKNTVFIIGLFTSVTCGSGLYSQIAADLQPAQNDVSIDVSAFDDTGLGDLNPDQMNQMLEDLKKHEKEITWSEKMHLAYTYFKLEAVRAKKNVAEHVCENKKKYIAGLVSTAALIGALVYYYHGQPKK